MLGWFGWFGWLVVGGGFAAAEDGAPRELRGWGIAPIGADGPSGLIDPTTGKPPTVRFVQLRICDLIASPDEGFRPLYAEEIWAKILEKEGEFPLKSEDKVALRLYLFDSNEGQLGQCLPESTQAPNWTMTAAKVFAWGDSEFLELHSQLLSSVSLMMEQHPTQIAWLDIGTYGDYGEWHTGKGEVIAGASPEELMRILDDYLVAIPKGTGTRRLGGPAGIASVEGPQVGLSITFDVLLGERAADRAQRVAEHGGVGLRNDCLDGRTTKNGGPDLRKDMRVYRSVLEEHRTHLEKFGGPWGGEFCNSDEGAIASMKSKGKGDDKPAEQTVAIVEACGWSFLASAGSNLLDPAVRQNRLLPKVDSQCSSLGPNYGGEDQICRLVWSLKSADVGTAPNIDQCIEAVRRVAP